MTYSQKLRGLFPQISLSWEDLLLLETFQIKYLPDRVPQKEFAILLHAYPVVYRFLISKNPFLAAFFNGIMEENKPEGNDQPVEEQCQEALWEIADLIIYNKHPDIFDTQAPVKWEIEEITAITPLEGKVVADVGAGSGRIAFLVAPFAQTVYAVEPLASFRCFMKEKAEESEVRNLFVMDGYLDSIPLPNHTLDVLVTSNAIGWKLEEELREIERVVRPGGRVIHLFHMDIKQDNPFHNILVSSLWNYTCLKGGDGEKLKLRYTKKT